MTQSADSVNYMELPCAIVRGGTTKAVFIDRQYLPVERTAQDRYLSALMGSPDPRQIDGLGGADPLTSKVVLLNRCADAGIDLEYESIEVAIGDLRINRAITCGNLLSAAGYFAAATGMIELADPRTTLLIRSRNTGKLIEAEFASPGRRLQVAGNVHIDGVGGSGAPVELRFLDPVGTRFPQAAPLGMTSQLTVGRRQVTVSVVDAAALYCFVPMAALDVDPAIQPADIDADATLRAAVEQIRTQIVDALNALGQASMVLDAGALKVALVGAARRPGAALKAIVVNREKTHKTMSIGGTIAIAYAARMPGTVVSVLLAGPVGGDITIEHPSGTVTAGIGRKDNASSTEYVSLTRTARILMRGTALVPVPR